MPPFYPKELSCLYLGYRPTLPTFTASFANESGFDSALATFSNKERLEYFNEAVEGLETDDIKLSGIFSCSPNIVAQVSIVQSHSILKWVVIAEQSAQKSQIESIRTAS